MSSIFNYEKIYRAYLSCRKNKRKTVNALEFEIDFENNLRYLLRDLQQRKYIPGRSICFAVAKPKLREIFAADFHDRVVHHLFVNEIIKYAERKYIYDSYACIEGRGNLRAVQRLDKFIRQDTNSKEGNWYLKMDISGFFANIDQKILFSIFSKFIKSLKRNEKWKEEILWLGEVFIFDSCQNNYIIKGDRKLLKKIPANKSMLSRPLGKGLPIGNYTSQFFANLYMNELDQFVKRKLKARRYLRYVDDFVIVSKNKKKLRTVPKIINAFLWKELKMQLNSKKTVLRTVEQGIDFLGYYIKTSHILVRNEVVGRLKSKINLEEGVCERKISVINSYFGHFRQANSFSLRKSICVKLDSKFVYNNDYLKINKASLA